MAENAEARMKPMTTLRMLVQNRSTWGSNKVNGATPRIENQITALRPILSPIGPPKNVPAATAPRNRNRCSCELATDRSNFSIR
ncbi:hypothetical protein D3C86_1902730 [compost metagenome]